MRVPSGFVWFIGGYTWCRPMLAIWAIRNRFKNLEFSVELRGCHK